MAQRDNRGIGGFAPFPTFAPGGEGGLIPTVKMPQGRMSFPTPRGGGGGGKSVNPAAYFAPGIVGALTEKFLPKPKTKKRESTGDERLDRILMEADLTYGADREDPTFLQNLLPSLIDAGVAAGFGDEGGAQYAQTAVNRKIASRTAETGVASAKRQFIKERLKPETAQDLTLIDVNKARVGVIDPRNGYFLPDSKEFFVYDPKNKKANSLGYVSTSDVEGSNFIDIADFDTGSQNLTEFFKDPQYKELLAVSKEQMAKDSSILNTQSLINDSMGFLDEAIADPTKNPTTVVSTFLNFGNDVLTNFDQIASLNGTRSIESFFSTGTGGTLAGDGSGAKELYAALKGGDENQISLVSDRFAENMGIDLKGIMGDAAYRNVRMRANLLQLAYMAAAANGQTGRTLSDKDLAYHLRIIGFGASQDPRVLKANLLAFGDSLEKGSDIQTAVYLPKEGMGRFNLEEKQAQSMIGLYYDPAVDGEGNKQWTNYLGYTFRPYATRYADNPIYKKYKNHPRALAGTSSSVTDDGSDTTDIDELTDTLQGI